MPSVPSILKTAADEIRTSDAVAVIGAGASFETGMPLAGQLSPLVWHALDAHPAVMRAACDALGITPGRPKEVIGGAWSRIRAAFSQIAADPGTRRTFQATFAQLDRERSLVPSPAHTALARLVHCGRVLHVVSLNWDTQLEAAFRALYGIDINAQGIRLSKPHGDCRHTEESWILPHESGSIPDELADRMTTLATERPRTLLIIGYSERDDLIVERLIRPLVDRWRVFRISPTATGEGAILPAQKALDILADELCPDPEFPGWHYVTFENQRGIEAAIAGERLGPKDVEACPRLPHFDSAARALELLHSVQIAGVRGCGKSLTAWQLAGNYHCQGWEVLRADPKQADVALAQLRALRQSKWKRVLVVDDERETFPMQDLPNRLGEVAHPGLKAVWATTDAEGEQSRGFRVPVKAAVGILADAFRRRRDEILPLVRRLRILSREHDGYLDVPLERRIDEAETSETPWLFFAFARFAAGWSEARPRQRGIECPPRTSIKRTLLLIAVAARQLLSLDAGCRLEDLVSGLRRISGSGAPIGPSKASDRRFTQYTGDPAGRSPSVPPYQFRRGRDQELLRQSESRGLHDRSSRCSRVLLWSRHLLPAIRGISWFLHELLDSEAFAAAGQTKWAFLLPEQHVDNARSSVRFLPRPQSSWRDSTCTFIRRAIIDHLAHPSPGVDSLS